MSRLFLPFAVVLLTVQAQEGLPPGFIKADLDAPVAIVTFTAMNKVLEDSHNKVWLLWFYAPWCEHCKTLAPQYEHAARSVRGLRFAKIDGTWG
jgi:thiol-disulfide isomerase/thioredoxin